MTNVTNTNLYDISAPMPIASIVDTTTNISYDFPFYIDSLEWSYQLNSQSYDTIGGRVTQLLSVRFSTMSLQGEAGSRGALMALYDNFKTVQNNQNLSKRAMTLHIPSNNQSKSLSFSVFLESFQMQWDITTVTYPFAMTFEVDQELTTKVATQAATLAALNAYSATNSDGIGFSEAWTGLGVAGAASLSYSSIITAVQNAGGNGISLFTNN
jgi:hypothetical protein